MARLEKNAKSTSNEIQNAFSMLSKFKFRSRIYPRWMRAYLAVIQPIVSTTDSIKRLIKWAPIIWSDRDWDHYFILNVLKMKIKFFREHIEKYGLHVNKGRDCKNMLIAELLIERLQNPSQYVEHYKAEYDRKWPTPEGDILELLNRNFSKEETADFKRLMQLEEEAWNRDFKYLSEHLRKHLRQWWD